MRVYYTMMSVYRDSAFSDIVYVCVSAYKRAWETDVLGVDIPVNLFPFM